MGQSIFADESGDGSARGHDADGRQSIFRRCEQDSTDAIDATDDDSGTSTREGSESDDGTMTVFSGDEVFEVGIDDE